MWIRVRNQTTEKGRRGVVYEVPYAECKYVYIEETGRSFSERLKEHWYTVNRGNTNSGVAAHAWSK